MNILFNGVEISHAIEATESIYTDNAVGRADLLEMIFADRQGYLWSQWNAMSGVKEIEVKKDSLSTGKMYPYYTADAGSRLILLAVSLPKSVKTKRTTTWVDVTLAEIGSSLCERNGFIFKPYCDVSMRYGMISQVDTADFLFLSNLCLFEGLYLKVYNGQIIVYDPEHAKTGITINREDVDGPIEFSRGAQYGKVTLVSNDLSYTHGESAGLEHTVRTYLNSLGEAERWARNLYVAMNRQFYSAGLSVRLNTQISAGAKVKLDGFPGHRGDYFIESAAHKLVSQRTELLLSGMGG